MKIYNFAAGPAMLPQEVMLKAQEEYSVEKKVKGKEVQLVLVRLQ